MSNVSIPTSFSRYFYIKAADTPELVETVFRIRYQVYCQEFGYEREEDCPGGMERDEYDDQSAHCLLIHKPTGLPAGCVRLVKPLQNDPAASLPFELHCKDSLRKDMFDIGALSPGSYGEFSRLAVLSTFRRRKSDEQKPFSLTEKDLEPLHSRGRDSFPFIPVSLFLTALVLFLNSDLKHVFAMMEPRLCRLLRRFGILFTPVGEVMDYHGPRGPFVLAREDVLVNLDPDIYELMMLIDKMLSKTGHNT